MQRSTQLHRILVQQGGRGFLWLHPVFLCRPGGWEESKAGGMSRRGCQLRVTTPSACGHRRLGWPWSIGERENKLWSRNRRSHCLMYAVVNTLQYFYLELTSQTLLLPILLLHCYICRNGGLHVCEYTFVWIFWWGMLLVVHLYWTDFPEYSRLLHMWNVHIVWHVTFVPTLSAHSELNPLKQVWQWWITATIPYLHLSFHIIVLLYTQWHSDTFWSILSTIHGERKNELNHTNTPTN